MTITETIQRNAGVMTVSIARDVVQRRRQVLPYIRTLQPVSLH